MKILQVCQTHPPEFSGGSSMYAIRLAKELVRNGFPVDILCTTSDQSIRPYELKSDKNDIYNVIRMGIPRQRTYGRRHTNYIRKIFQKYLLENNYELLNFHSAVGIGEGIILAAKDVGIPCIVTLHDGWWICPSLSFVNGKNNNICNSANLLKCFICRIMGEIKKEPIERWPRALARTLLNNYWILYYRQKYLNYASGMITTCNFLKYKHFEYGINTNIVVIKICIDETEIDFKQIGNTNHPVRFSSLGLFRPNKGAELLVGALKSLKNKTEFFEYRVWGPIDAVVMSKVGDSLNELPIVVHGPYEKSNLNKIFSMTDVLVLCSCGEGYPLVLLEALASRTPVIAAKSHGMVEIIKEGKNGIYFEPFNKNSLSKALEYFIDNPDTISSMQKNINPPMPYTEMVDDIIDTYLKIINNK